MTSDNLVSALLGGIISALVLPIVVYFATRLIAKLKTRIVISVSSFNIENTFRILNLRIENNSYTSLKNVNAYIFISYENTDRINDEIIHSYIEYVPDQPLMLSWAKTVQQRNESSADINQAESLDLNVMRFHRRSTGKEFIDIASEEGFGGNSNKNAKSRMLLKASKDYQFQILITAENMLPIKKSFEFVAQDIKIRNI